MSRMTVDSALEQVKTGDRIRFEPQSNNRWWTVRARDERFIICDQLAPFQKAGDSLYTIMDATGWDSTRNGVKPGPVRSSSDLVGGGYDMEEPDWAERMLAELQGGGLQLSIRRAVEVDEIEKEER